MTLVFAGVEQTDGFSLEQEHALSLSTMIISRIW